MPRHSFVQIQKITNVKGRIDYISSHARQENLYAVYHTAPSQFWKSLAKENQQEFQKSGTEGKCVEARELIIALPEIYTKLAPDTVLQTFTDSFKETYDVECVAALHHNKKKTNYHIHLIFSERTALEKPEIKFAARNMFYNEQRKHVRTKKEILDEQGAIRTGCTIISKGELYEIRKFSNKNPYFKSDEFLDSEKKRLTVLINSNIENPLEQLQVFDRNGVYLSMKKIGKNNPKEADIKADNEVRKIWNQTVDIALIQGITEPEIKKIRQEEIVYKVQQSIIKCGKKPGLFYGIVLNTKEVLVKLLQQHKVPPKPQLSVDIKEFRKMQDIKQELDQQVQAIHYIEDSELPELHRQPEEIKGIFKTKDRKMVEKEIKDTERRLSEIKSDLTKVVTRYGYKNVQSFIRVFWKSERAVRQYQIELAEWKANGGTNPPRPEGIREQLKKYERELKERKTAMLYQPITIKEKNQNER